MKKALTALIILLAIIITYEVIEEEFVSKDIDFPKVLWFAERASAAYETESLIKEKFPQTVRVTNLEQIDVQYFLEYLPDQKLQVLSVRGTANLKNAKEDVEYMKSRNQKLNIQIHSGFDKDAIQVYTDVLPHLNKEFPIAVTGHSLGAAIATVLMMYLHEDGYTLVHAYNFGQPKVTNRAGVETYQSLPVTRVVNKNDVVTLVPPITLLDSIHGLYEHLGEEIILLHGTEYVYLDKHDATSKSLGNFWKNIAHESVSNHFMDNYLKNIKSKITTSKQVPYGSREKHIKNNILDKP